VLNHLSGSIYIDWVILFYWPQLDTLALQASQAIHSSVIHKMPYLPHILKIILV